MRIWFIIDVQREFFKKTIIIAHCKQDNIAKTLLFYLGILERGSMEAMTSNYLRLLGGRILILRRNKSSFYKITLTTKEYGTCED